MKTVLLHNSAFLCVTRFLPLSPSGFVNAFLLSHSMPFLPFFKVIPEIFSKLYLGNLDARRDWGYARDYVECMWLILQHDTPEDFVIATGEMHTVREFATLAFKEVGIELRWEGEGVNEKGIDVKTGKPLVEVDAKYFRPCEVEQLLGDPMKAKTLLGWNPTKTSFPKLVKIMVEHDMRFVKKLYLKVQISE